jgi:tRNA 2-(methylsulfanyl)-N6-isopentenyladenosine37 hydroxylase
MLPDLNDFLACATPAAWVEAALQNQDVMLIDHGNCEKKAAGSAFQLMFRYVDKPDLQNKMSRLAREELRHFEQVLAIIRRREIELRNVGSSRYAAGLRELVRNHEPYRLTDTLVIGAFIEARSCERFAMLVPHLDEELGKFYHGLLKSEARHFQDVWRRRRCGRHHRSGARAGKGTDRKPGQRVPVSQRRAGGSLAQGEWRLVVAVFIHLQCPPLSIPVAQHDPLGGLAIYLEVMCRRSMGMAVDQRAYAMLGQHAGYQLRGDVDDVAGFHARLGTAFVA